METMQKSGGQKDGSNTAKRNSSTLVSFIKDLLGMALS